MKSRSKILLLIDGIVNLLLGMLLLLFPFGMAQILGVPQSNSNFYPTILHLLRYKGLAVDDYGFALDASNLEHPRHRRASLDFRSFRAEHLTEE